MSSYNWVKKYCELTLDTDCPEYWWKCHESNLAIDATNNKRLYYKNNSWGLGFGSQLITPQKYNIYEWILRFDNPQKLSNNYFQVGICNDFHDTSFSNSIHERNNTITYWCHHGGVYYKFNNKSENYYNYNHKTIPRIVSGDYIKLLVDFNLRECRYYVSKDEESFSDENLVCMVKNIPESVSEIGWRLVCGLNCNDGQFRSNLVESGKTIGWTIIKSGTPLSFEDVKACVDLWCRKTNVFWINDLTNVISNFV